MKTCTCCGEDKPKSYFSSSDSNPSGYAPHCKDCGVWLQLLRKHFGPTRKWNENRAKTAERYRMKRAAEQAEKARHLGSLYQVFGIQLPREKVSMDVRTVLAQAPWPYREAA